MLSTFTKPRIDNAPNRRDLGNNKLGVGGLR